MSEARLQWRQFRATPALALAAMVEPGHPMTQFSYGPLVFDCFNAVLCPTLGSSEPGSGQLRDGLRALDRYCRQQLGSRLIICDPINSGVFRACRDTGVDCRDMAPPDEVKVSQADVLLQIAMNRGQR